MKKSYDRSYYDRWYRGSNRIRSDAELQRKVVMAVSVAEFFLRRPVRSVLDVGCGEAPWFTHLRALRPRVAYTGIESSDYAIERFGRERNIQRGSVGGLSVQGRRYDLIVCADVLHYVNDRDVRHGVRAMSRLSRGLVYLEVLTKEDEIIGDLHDFNRRPAQWYRDLCERNNMTFVGPYSWLAPALRPTLAELEGRQN
jgi:SAM-dependent methyltransferase